ncbi:MFS transporter [Actinocorallia lasiicapitis]
MADTTAAPATTRRGGGVPYGWRLVGIFSLTQTVGYGVLFYSFAVILTPMRTELGLSTATVSGAMTVGLLVCAVASVPAGRILDRHGGRALMTLGSIAGTALVAAWSQVQNTVQLYLVFAGIGLVSAMVLYEAAFAVIVTWFERRRGTALLAVTIVAGFASTIFMPLTGWLTDARGWRDAVLILAVVHGLCTIPLHLFVRRPDGDAEQPVTVQTTASDRAEIQRAALRDPFYRLLGLALVAHALTSTVLGVHLVAYLIDLGHPAAFAATVTGLLGVLSVTGRLVTTAVSRRASLTTIAAVIFTIQAAAALLLPLAGRGSAGAIGCVLGIGLGFGVVSIIKPALLAARYGTAAFGTLSGLIMLPTATAKALGPFAAAALLTATDSYTPVILTVGAAFLLSALTTHAAGRHLPERSGPGAGPLPHQP